MSLLDAAQDYAERGFRVFPLFPFKDGVCACGGCTVPGKHPRIKGWPKNATTDAEQIGIWWQWWPDAGIGIATGAGSGMWALDVDGQAGFDTLQQLEEQHGTLDDVPVAQTGSGGAHLFFANDERVPNSVKRLPGLDTRGQGGYIVAPPSSHISGTSYEWLTEPNGTLPAAPEWLVALFEKRQAPKSGAPTIFQRTAQAGGSSTYGLAALQAECTALAEASSGRNALLNRAAFAAAQLAAGGELGEKEAQSAVWDAAVRSAHNGPDDGDEWLADGGEESLRRTFDSGWSDGFKQPRKAPRDPKALLARGDDVELAQMLLEDLGGELAFDLDAMHRYDPARGLWTHLDEDELARVVQGYAGAWINKGKNKDGMQKKAPLLLNHGRVKGTLRQAYHRAGQRGFFDAEQAGIVFINGTLTADGLQPHSPDYRHRVGLPIAFDPTARAPRFEQYLAEVFDGDSDAVDKVQLLQEFAGAVLMGCGADHQRCLVLYGLGADGKSVALEVLKALVPETAQAAISPHDFGHEYHKARLAGVHLNAVAEMPGTDIASSELFKAIVTGDCIEGRHPAGRPFMYRPRAAHVFACNRLPGTRDTTRGFWRRFMVLGFNNRFEGADAVLGLGRRLVATERSGLIAWAYKGAQRLAQAGVFTMPASSLEVAREWQQNSDQVLAFLNTELEVLPDGAPTSGGTQPQQLYQIYVSWARMTGAERPLRCRKFWSRLKELGHESTKSTGTRFFRLRKKQA